MGTGKYATFRGYGQDSVLLQVLELVIGKLMGDPPPHDKSLGAWDLPGTRGHPERTRTSVRYPGSTQETGVWAITRDSKKHAQVARGSLCA